MDYLIDPTLTEIRGFRTDKQNRGEQKMLRGILDGNGVVYVWDGYEACHDTFLKDRGIDAKRYFYLYPNTMKASLSMWSSSCYHRGLDDVNEIPVLRRFGWYNAVREHYDPPREESASVESVAA